MSNKKEDIQELKEKNELEQTKISLTTQCNEINNVNEFSGFENESKNAKSNNETIILDVNDEKIVHNRNIEAELVLEKELNAENDAEDAFLDDFVSNESEIESEKHFLISETGAPNKTTDKYIINIVKSDPIIPISVTKKIIKCDEDLQTITANEIQALNEGSQVLFNKFIGKCLSKCKENKRKTVFMSDIVDVIKENYEFSFLKDLYDDETFEADKIDDVF
ncbi:hypothetical protein EDEG_02784 [Edhazardia aedis USNM 41457]|uniref:Transcription factor CBF/NF-Y/archaeal histone domain-containing protein n=1 Tax=Edhazardia aedis (strain USNM 41457) TaxID=1003232 RepID=J8ZT45_EDHAE|nr:hypothetical protein EDEG_02784 [Edhazardia aedis USNM 41457]|eukprot:EJW02843.1 hypothetical protein EDEG_02784 [Edhazardia aedis USNM 41457]